MSGTGYIMTAFLFIAIGSNVEKFDRITNTFDVNISFNVSMSNANCHLIFEVPFIPHMSQILKGWEILMHFPVIHGRNVIFFFNF